MAASQIRVKMSNNNNNNSQRITVPTMQKQRVASLSQGHFGSCNKVSVKLPVIIDLWTSIHLNWMENLLRVQWMDSNEDTNFTCYNPFIYVSVCLFFAFLCIPTGKACDLSVTQGWGPGKATFTTCPDRQFADKCWYTLLQNKRLWCAPLSPPPPPVGELSFFTSGGVGEKGKCSLETLPSPSQL